MRVIPSMQIPCSRCSREPRRPGQRWGRRCFAIYKREWRRQQREKRDAAASSSQRPTNINRQRQTAPSRWFAPLIEQTKRVVQEIAKYPRRPETIRISLFPRGHNIYADIRVYLAGKPTGKGVAIHRDLLPQVIAALQQALQGSWHQFPAQQVMHEETRAWEKGQTSVHWPEWP